STVAILWIMALWSSWECRGLFVDGAALLINLVQQWHVIFFRESRLYAVTGGQSLALVGIHLGITDLHRLA
ncbi:hypothetical protein ACPXBS_26580, partial [Escherichia coli]|uniref:hypothetical protein n=1 Tax=Escherichia coli TaxID=562 RepID=UPI003CE48901